MILNQTQKEILILPPVHKLWQDQEQRLHETDSCECSAVVQGKLASKSTAAKE